MYSMDFPGGSDGKASAYSVGDLGSIPGSGRSSGEGKNKEKICIDISPKKIYTKGQHVYENMLNFTNYQGIANPNHMRYSSYMLEPKRKKIINLGKNVEKSKPLYTVARIITCHSHYGKQYGIFSKV